jgi:hypothetical protein
MNELIQVLYNSYLRLASLEINNMHANIPTNELTPLITAPCNWYNKGKEIKKEIIKLTKVILRQNYFKFNDSIYTQTKGLARGPPTHPFFPKYTYNIWNILLSSLY